MSKAHPQGPSSLFVAVARRWFWRGLLLWAVLLVAVAALAVGRVAPIYRDARHFVVDLQGAFAEAPQGTADYAAIAHTSGNLFGINTFLYQEVEEAKIRRSLAMIKEAGFGYIREQVAWQEIERGRKGNFTDERWNNRSTWTKLDQLVELVQEYGLEMIARVDYPPDWSLPPGANWHATPPAHYEDYGDFVYALASRYRGRIRYYQIWNEPNLTIEWGMKPVDPVAYVRLLKVAYTRIKEADPEAVVIAAALAPTIEEGPLNMSDLTFLRRMYEAGAKDYFDIASVNPYGLRSGPDDRRTSADDTNFSRPIQARQIMVEYGDAGKPIWASETGWCALPEDFPDAPDYGRTTRAQQAGYTRRAYERVQREWPWMGMMALWHFRMVDNRLGTGQPYYFGAVGDDFVPFPVFEQLGHLASSPPVLYPGFRQEDNRALAYAGAWRREREEEAALGAYAAGSGDGASVSFRFWGSDLDLVVGRGPHGGRVAVSVDGGAALAPGAARDASGRLIVDLYAPHQQWQVSVPVAWNLPVKEHSVTLELQGDGEMQVDGFVVRAREGRSPLPLAALLAAGTLGFLYWARGVGRGPAEGAAAAGQGES